MAANETKKEGAGVPYTSFKTLTNTLDKMAEQGGAPSRVDRSYLSNMPGGERGIFITGLKYLGLVNESLEPTEDLHLLIEADEEGRKEIMRRVVERVYVEPLALPKRATQQQLETAFREYGISGSTLRRAIGFFLAATEYAGIDRSPHFKLPPRERTKTKPKAEHGPERIPERNEQELPPRRDETDGLDPFIIGLVRRLPKPGEVFTTEMRKTWLATAENVFNLIYKSGSDSTEARPQPSDKESG